MKAKLWVEIELPENNYTGDMVKGLIFMVNENLQSEGCLIQDYGFNNIEENSIT